MLITGRLRGTLVDPRGGPDGHYRGSAKVDAELVYVVQTDAGGQEVLAPEEFARRFGWKNDPQRVRLGGK